MLNYGITQNDQISISDAESDGFEFDLSLYEELGHNAYQVGDETEAMKWYSRGLKLAKQSDDHRKTKLFSNLIYTCL